MTRRQRARLGCGDGLSCSCARPPAGQAPPAFGLSYMRPQWQRPSTALGFHRPPGVRLSYLGAARIEAAVRAPARPAPAPARAAAPVLPTSAITALPPSQTPAASAAPAAAAPANSVQAIIAQICPQGITKGNCGCGTDTANVQTLFETSIQSLYLQWPPPDPSWANCSGIQGSSALQTAGKVAGGAGGVAASILALSPATGPAAPFVAAGAGLVALVSSLFGAGHAKAVAAQNNALCISVPEFNSVLQQIDAGVVPASAAGYQALAAAFQKDMQGGTSYKKCDALYAYNLAAQMVIAARLANLGAGTGGGTGLTTSVAGLPLWLLLLGGGAALFLL